MRKERSSEKTPAQVAEAAAWVAHLHSTDRTPDSDRGLKLWIKDDPARQRAWEMAAEAWEDLHLMPTSEVVQELEVTRKGIRTRRRNVGAMALAATLLVGLLSVLLWRDPAVTTAVGEQRTISLEDGTQVTLNTATRIVIHYGEHERRVELESGEAFFDVAQRVNWPFVVEAGDRRVTALGTTFMVRREEKRVSVVLIDGKVSVSDTSDTERESASAKNEIPEERQGRVLSPGQRLVLIDETPAKIDQPSLNKVTAWRRGQVVFEYARLADAIAEMNRYSARPLSLGDPRAAEVHVSGVFKYGDSLEFAHAVAATYGLQVVEIQGGIALAGAPERAYR
jgi:transmembrane sensor